MLKWFRRRQKQKKLEANSRLADAWLEDLDRALRDLEAATDPAERFSITARLAQYWIFKGGQEQAEKYIAQAEALLPYLADVPEDTNSHDSLYVLTWKGWREAGTNIRGIRRFTMRIDMLRRQLEALE